MKILLLEHPRSISVERCNDIANTPLSSSLISGNIAGTLAASGHQVTIVEGFLDRLSYDRILGIIESFQPDFLGIHIIYNWNDHSQLYDFLKQFGKSGIRCITAYGFYPTFAYEEIFANCPEIKTAILGEPEYTYSELVECLTQNATCDYSTIPGLAWKDNGKVRASRRAPIKNLDALPFPMRTEGMLKIGEINVEGSRGCYGGCTFCYINPYYGESSCWRGRSPGNIMEEIDGLLEQYGNKNFYFVDPNFFGPGRKGRARILQLASMLEKRHISFGIEGRVNDINEDVIGPLVDAGLNQILVGLESGKDESLKRLNKMTTVEQNENALRTLRKYGIEPNIGFIMFEPDSSLDDIRTNFDFLKRNELLHNLAITSNVLYHPQIILQGTTAYGNLMESGRLQTLSTPYEGTASFADGKVAALAQAMQKITNHIFQKMGAYWSGLIANEVDQSIVSRKINRLLIQYFADALSELESGQFFAKQDITALAEKAGKEISGVFSLHMSRSMVENREE